MTKTKSIFTKTALSLTPSPMVQLNTQAQELIAQGQNIINLTAGEPDCPTPAPIKTAAKIALDHNYTRYAPAAGIRSLRQAVAKKLTTINRLPASWQEVVIGVGAKQLLSSTLELLCQSGDQVIIPTPAWGTFIAQVRLTGARPVLLPLTPPFILTAKALASQINSHTKVIILNSPSNPTGAVIPRSQLTAIARLAVRRQIFIISDETYEHFTYGKNRHISLASLTPSIRPLTITINTFSKTYAMTGWRVGYAHAQKPIAQKLAALASHTTTGTSSISQYAALKAITGSPASVSRMVRRFTLRRRLVAQKLSRIPRLSFTLPQGAFYFFINVKQTLRLKETTIAWCERLLKDSGVALIPGEAFASPGYVRLSFTAPPSVLNQALNRLSHFTKSL